jgi:DNA polymerase III subunit gamma/tau
MRSAGNFRSEWGYLAPVPSFARTARIVLVATAIGATAGAGVVLSLVDRSPQPERTSVAARAIVTGLHEAAAPAASQTSAVPIAPAAAPVTAPAVQPALPPVSSPVAPSDVATQSPNHALVPSTQPANQRAAAPSTEANASAQGSAQGLAQGPAPVTTSENNAPASAHETRAAQTSAPPANPIETSATQPNSEPANAAPHPAAGVAALSEPSATGTAADATDSGTSAQEQALAQKKVKHHVANERTPFPALGTFFRRFFVAHVARPNYSNR